MSEADMTGHARKLPEGASVVIPRLFCRDPVAEIAFCTTVFDAIALNRRPGPDGTIAHALITIGPAMVMIESEWPEIANRAPVPDGSSPVVLYVYVEDVDDTMERAMAAGARMLMPVTNQFWGDRTGWFMDPSGHVWTVASRIEETTEAEREERFDRIRNAGPSGA
jgi:PhnB protein